MCFGSFLAKWFMRKLIALGEKRDSLLVALKSKINALFKFVNWMRTHQRERESEI